MTRSNPPATHRGLRLALAWAIAPLLPALVWTGQADSVAQTSALHDPAWLALHLALAFATFWPLAALTLGCMRWWRHRRRARVGDAAGAAVMFGMALVNDAVLALLLHTGAFAGPFGGPFAGPEPSSDGAAGSMPWPWTAVLDSATNAALLAAAFVLWRWMAGPPAPVVPAALQPPVAQPVSPTIAP